MVQIFDKYGVLKRPSILGVASWGNIIGTITDQVDLISYLSSNYYPLLSNPAGYLTSASLSGYVPISRTLTINGVTYDLSADRSWTIAAGVTTVTATSPITSSGGATPNISTSMNTNKLIGRGTAGVGVMEEITLGTGLSFSGNTLNATATVTPAALSKTDDTNVTLTLGGTPLTALLQATSLTLGWTGTLAVSRGGTGLSALGTANQLIRVNALGTDLEYFTPTYGSGTVTSVAALTIGTTGTDLTSTVANPTTTPVITLNVPTASALNRGALSPTDWSTFNAKTSIGLVQAMTQGLQNIF